MGQQWINGKREINDLRKDTIITFNLYGLAKSKIYYGETMEENS